MPNSIKPLIFLLILLAAGLYLYAIIIAGLNSIKGLNTIPPFFSNAAIVIAGVLSTNFGAVVGITLQPPAKNVPASFLGLRAIGKPVIKARHQNKWPVQVQGQYLLTCRRSSRLLDAGFTLSDC